MRLCRLCKHPDILRNSISMFDDRQLAADFYFTMQIPIVEINLPKADETLICQRCSKKVKGFADFKRQCLKSDNEFKATERFYFSENLLELKKSMKMLSEDPAGGAGEGECSTARQNLLIEQVPVDAKPAISKDPGINFPKKKGRPKGTKKLKDAEIKETNVNLPKRSIGRPIGSGKLKDTEVKTSEKTPQNTATSSNATKELSSDLENISLKNIPKRRLSLDLERNLFISTKRQGMSKRRFSIDPGYDVSKQTIKAVPKLKLLLDPGKKSKDPAISPNTSKQRNLGDTGIKLTKNLEPEPDKNTKSMDPGQNLLNEAGPSSSIQKQTPSIDKEGNALKSLGNISAGSSKIPKRRLTLDPGQNLMISAKRQRIPTRRFSIDPGYALSKEVNKTVLKLRLSLDSGKKSKEQKESKLNSSGDPGQNSKEFKKPKDPVVNPKIPLENVQNETKVQIISEPSYDLIDYNLNDNCMQFVIEASEKLDDILIDELEMDETDKDDGEIIKFIEKLTHAQLSELTKDILPLVQDELEKEREDIPGKAKIPQNGVKSPGKEQTGSGQRRSKRRNSILKSSPKTRAKLTKN